MTTTFYPFCTWVIDNIEIFNIKCCKILILIRFPPFAFKRVVRLRLPEGLPLHCAGDIETKMSGNSLFDIRKKLLREVSKLEEKNEKGTKTVEIVPSFEMIQQKNISKQIRDTSSINEISAAVFALREVYLDQLKLTKIDNLECLNKIQVLHLQHNRIQRIQGLEFAPELRVLRLDYNQISKIENLNHLKHLTILNLSHNKISEVDPDELPKSLVDVRLDSNPCKKYEKDITEVLPLLQLLDTQPTAKAGNDENEVDESWKQLFEENRKKIKEYKRSKGGKSMESEIDEKELLKVWQEADAKETEVYLEEILKESNNSGVGENGEVDIPTGVGGVCEEIKEKLKILREKHAYESKAILERARRAMQNARTKQTIKK